MKQRNLLWHLLIPAGVLSAFLVTVARRSTSSIEDEAVGLAANAMYLLAPYAAFFLLVAAVKPRPLTAHAGLLGLGMALLTVLAIGYLGTPDPSGLPYHWLLYWPLCLFGILTFCATAALIRRIRSGV